MKEKMLKGILADKYKPEKIPTDIDTIVIGSGMGGLSCAAILSQMGKKVLVLEQHYVAGGGSHMFELKGGLMFDSGLHYLVPYSGHLLWMAAGGPEMPVRFEVMGEPDGTFDRIVLGDRPPFKIKNGEAHMDELYAQFPDHHAEIDEYLKVSECALKLFPVFVLSKLLPLWLQKPWHRFVLGKNWKKYAGSTTKDVLEGITDNKTLAGLLAGTWMDTGSPPDRVSFMMGMCVARGLAIEGGAYPVGGSTSLAKALIPVIEKAGGRVLVRANVKQILIDEKKDAVTGVEMEDGRVINCAEVVSSAGYYNTYSKLVAEDVTKKLDIPQELSVDSSSGFLMVNLGLDGTPEELGLTCANLWYHPTREDGDMYAAVMDFTNDHENHEPMIGITFPSIKDQGDLPIEEQKHPGKTTCQILCTVEYKFFEKYANTISRKRGVDYKALKKEWSDRLIAILLRHYPQLEDKIDLVDVSTPLSIEHYLGTHKGGSVSLDHTPARFTDWDVVKHLDSRTKIKGLWMTGQDTVTCGQPISQGAGLLTALRMMGFWQSMKYMKKVLPPTERQQKKHRTTVK